MNAKGVKGMRMSKFCPPLRDFWRHLLLMFYNKMIYKQSYSLEENNLITANPKIVHLLPSRKVMIVRNEYSNLRPFHSNQA